MRHLRLCMLAATLAACGDDEHQPFDPYARANVTVIGDNTLTMSGPVVAGDCVQVTDVLCVPVDRDSAWCERDGGPVDVVVVDGEPVEVVCYPPATDARRPIITVDGSSEGDLAVAQSANDTTVVFDSRLDGVPLVGDVVVDGNRVSIFGNGPERTIIDGDVTITGNNVRLRGVTITGNLRVALNNAAIVLSRIHGDVLIAKNGSVVVECDVYGSFTSTSNGNVLVGNDVQGAWSVSGAGIMCDENRAFIDGDGNHAIDDRELTGVLGCP